MLDRRRFLFSSAAVAAAAGVPFSLSAAEAQSQSMGDLPLPAKDLYDRDPEAYWAELRKQFLIPSDEVYLNNGTVGSSPRPVLRAIFDSYNQTEQMNQVEPEDYPIWGYAAWNEFRDPLAEFIGCRRDELAL